MFVLCPHCQFLVAVDPATGEPPTHCPRCDGAIAPPAAQAVAPTTAADAGIASDDHAVVEAAVVDPAVADDAIGGALLAPEAGLETPDAGPEAQAAERIVEAPPMAASSDEPATTAEAPAPPAAQAPVGPRRPEPAFAPAPTAGNRGHTLRHWRMPLMIAGLSLLLALQMLLADRAQLSTDARWRPALALLCSALRCDLPPWHEPAAFTLIDRDVRPDPRTPGVLHVRARFRNDARWPQPWPRVQLTLSDVDGRVAGARLFAPREYAAPAVTRDPIASGQVAGIVMDVIEPAPDIVAFTFDFR